MDDVRVSKVPCSKLALNAGHVLQILDCVEPEEVSIMCPLWDLVGSCGVQARADGGPSQDHGNNEFGSPKKCQTIACNAQAYRI